MEGGMQEREGAEVFMWGDNNLVVQCMMNSKGGEREEMSARAAIMT